MENTNRWPKTITVDKRIVRILSSSTYSNFPSAIREIIVNSYDADAENVTVDFDIDKKIISIIDDGKGMDENDFAFYLRIAGKSRKKGETETKSKRKIVGQFGVGFLSVLPFCDRYLIETKKRGTSQIVYATISSKEYFNDELAIDVDKIPINGGIKIDKSKFDEQYTRIRLVGFSKLTDSFLKSEYTIKNKRGTTKNFSPLELLKWELQDYLPLRYDKNDDIGRKLNKLSEESSIKQFNVFFDGLSLYRNIHARNILDISDSSISIGNIKFKYFISTDYKPISPNEARYLLIRNLNVGVGSRTTFDIGMDGKIYGKLSHLTGEILIEEGLNDLISVSRDKFNYSQDYEELKEFFRQKLRDIANDLDKVQSFENFIDDFQDNRKVQNIEVLRESTIAKNLDQLKNRGYEIIEKDIYNQINEQQILFNTEKRKISVDKNKKEIYINTSEDVLFKTIEVGKKNYKLRVSSWNYLEDDLPTIKILDNILYVNEAYPLFKDKSNFDTFLKLNIILFEYLNGEDINITVYKKLISDLLKTFQ